jgi:hypothetical protein
MFRNIKLKTASQEIILKSFDELTLEGVLRINRLPMGLFQAYIIDSERKIKPIPLNINLKDIGENYEVILQCIRNIDLRQVLPQKISYRKVNNPITLLHDINIGEDKCTETIHQIDEMAAREIVATKTEEFMKKYSYASRIIVGVSGGGDSNTLIKSLKEFLIKNKSDKKYICFTLIFDPIWPKSAARRASELCRENEVEHFIYEDEDIEKILKMTGNLKDFYNEFSEKFGNDATEFFGTYLVSLIARKLCKKYETNEYCLGFNREDILSELLFSLINGYRPLSFPVREFGPVKLLMPLWEIPKKILDACYPKYSIENYQERAGVTTFQRSIIYYLAHSIEDVYSNLGLSLMKGVQKLFVNSWSRLNYDEELDLYISEYIENSKISEAKNFLRKYFK